MRPRIAHGLVSLLLLSACGTSAASGATIVVPPPATPRAEPSPLNQASINAKHIHALTTRDRGLRLLVATHRGLVAAVPGGAAPRPLGAPSMAGDVLSLFYAPDGALYAAGHNLGVRVSHDDGASWSETSPDLAGADVHGLSLIHI